MVAATGRSYGGGGGKLSMAHAVLIVACLLTPVSADFMSWDQVQDATIPPFAQCGFTAVVTGETTSCVMLTSPDTGQPYQQCQSIFNAQLPAIPLGKVVCLDILKDGKFAGKFYIEFTTMIATATLTSEYYTSDWIYDFKEDHYCSNTHSCNSLPCSDYNTGKVPNTYNDWISDKEILHYKGKQVCILRSATRNSGQWYSTQECCNTGGCHDGVCMVGYAAIKPVGKVYQVFSINAVTYTPVINVFYADAALGAVFNEILIVNAGVAQSTFGYSLTLNGNYQNPSDTLFGNNYAILDLTNQSMYFSPAAPFGTPTAGMMGDIQFFAPSLPKGQQIGYSPRGPVVTDQPYNFADGLVDISGSTVLKAGSAVRHGVATFASAGYALPKTINNNMWSYDGTQIVSNLTTAGAASFSIVTTGGGVSIAVYTPHVCPDINVINATGCYNCLEGAVMNVQLTTRCDSGWVTIRTDETSISLGTSTILLENGILFSWLIPFTTHQAVNDFTVYICDELGNNCDQDHVQFIAFEYTRNDTEFNIANYTESYPDRPVAGNPKGAKDFFTRWFSDVWYNFFNGIASGLDIFIFFVELILFLIIGYYLVSYLLKLKNSNKMNDMQSEISKSWSDTTKWLKGDKGKMHKV